MNTAFNTDLSKNEVLALLEVAGKGDLRSYLNGAHIYADRSLLVSSDGVILLALRHEIHGTGSAFIPREVLEQGAKLLRKGQDKLRLAVTDGVISISAVGGSPQTLQAKAKDVGHLPFDKVFPSEVTNEPAQYDPRLVAKLGKAFDLLANAARSASPGLIITPNGAAAPALVGHLCVSDAIGLIMPFTIESRPDLLARARTILGMQDANNAEAVAQQGATP